jgi:hypothetical protein
LVQPEGGEAEEIICEENGILISTMLRQYFMGLRTVGQWKNLSEHWQHVAKECYYSPVESKKMWAGPGSATSEKPSQAWEDWLKKRTGIDVKPVNDDDSDDEVEVDEMSEKIDTEILLMRKFFSKWAKAAGVEASLCDSMTEEEIHVDWTQVIAPVVEGRITMVR